MFGLALQRVKTKQALIFVEMFCSSSYTVNQIIGWLAQLDEILITVAQILKFTLLFAKNANLNLKNLKKTYRAQKEWRDGRNRENKWKEEWKLRPSALLVDYAKWRKGRFCPKFCFPVILNCGGSCSLVTQYGSCANSTLNLVFHMFSWHLNSTRFLLSGLMHALSTFLWNGRNPIKINSFLPKYH